MAQIYIHSFPKVGTLYCKTLNLTTYLCKLPTSTWVAIGKKLGDKREQLQVCIQEQRCPLVLKGLRCHIVTDCVGFAFLSTCVSKEEFGWKTLLPCGGIMPIETTKMDAALGLFWSSVIWSFVGLQMLSLFTLLKDCYIVGFQHIQDSRTSFLCYSALTQYT